MAEGKLSGKVALVTGAASGIGLATCRLFGREGAHVIVTDIQDDAGTAAAESIGGSYRHLDVATETDWIDAMAAISAQHGRLDILVNNAGMAIAGDITELALSDWRRQQAVNVEGVFLGIKHGLKLLRASGKGAIVNVSSTTAISGSANLASYAASKGAVRSLTRSVALQCAARKDGVRVNAVYPGIIETPIYDALEGIPAQNKDGRKPFARDPKALGAALAPLGRAGRPEEVATSILYLASDDSGYVTGSGIVVDGGLIG